MQTDVDDRAVTRQAMPAADPAVERAIDALETIYVFREPDEVRDFLRRYPDLLPVLDEATERVAPLATGVGPAALEVVWDPDDDNDEGELFLVVPTVEQPEAVLPVLDRLQRNWLVDVAWSAQGRFNVALKYA